MRRQFQFFNPETDTSISRRNLPHWEQPHVCYFLTFRTADSLPKGVMAEWLAQRNAWLRAQGIDPDRNDWHSRLRALPDHLAREFHRTFSKRLHALLDACHGDCLLRRQDLRGIVTRALHHFDGCRYVLGGYVVMPNHAHVLAQCLGETTLRQLGHSWKHYTAHEIHKRLDRVGNGHFWQDETFDHIVRSREQFERCRNYLAENPAKAGLRDGEFSLFLPEVEPEPRPAPPA